MMYISPQMNEYLPYQFSGEVVQALADSWVSEFSQYGEALSFFYNLSIDTADEYWLGKIGEWIGYQWPLTPAGSWDATTFYYTNVATPLTSDVTGYGCGLYGSLAAAGTKIPIAVYRMALKAFAYMKYNGLSLASIDKIAYSFNIDYLLTANNYNWFSYSNSPTATSTLHGYGAGFYGSSSVPDSDISVVYKTNIGAGYIYVLQDIFDRFATAPKVYVRIGV